MADGVTLVNVGVDIFDRDVERQVDEIDAVHAAGEIARHVVVGHADGHRVRAVVGVCVSVVSEAGLGRHARRTADPIWRIVVDAHRRRSVRPRRPNRSWRL